MIAIVFIGQKQGIGPVLAASVSHLGLNYNDTIFRFIPLGCKI